MKEFNIPPKVIGDIVTTTGIAKEKIEPIMKALEGLEPTARATFINSLRNFISEE